jgi:hypothetical protein
VQRTCQYSYTKQNLSLSGDVQECGMSLPDWQKEGGEDKGSTVMEYPDDDMIIHWAREELLDF